MAKAMNKAQAKAQKRKVTLLIIMALVTATTWGKNLFGNADGDADPAVTSSANANPGAAGDAGNAPANPIVRRTNTGAATTSITSYDQAVKRMEIWPNALKRRVHEGIIEEIVPFETELEEEAISETEAAAASLVSAPVAEELPPPLIVVEPSIAFEALRLKLTTTAIMGESRYAKINGTKVTVGQTIEVQVGSETIRYTVSAINPREVEIRYSGETHLLRISSPELLNRGQDGA